MTLLGLAGAYFTLFVGGAGLLDRIREPVSDEPRPVAKDVKLLQESGLVLARRKPNPGHGVQTIISPIARKIDLVATLA